MLGLIFQEWRRAGVEGGRGLLPHHQRQEDLGSCAFAVAVAQQLPSPGTA